jgi:hypothetical protein
MTDKGSVAALGAEPFKSLPQNSPGRTDGSEILVGYTKSEASSKI